MPSQATWLDDPQTYDAWEWVQANEVPVCVQMKLSGIDRRTLEVPDLFRQHVYEFEGVEV